MREGGYAPIVLGAAGTLSCCVVGLLVWLDNRVGFRDAEALAALLASTFSMVTTVWVIITVWIQRTELNLQRKELALQREDSKRLAEETALQAQLMREQLMLSFKSQLALEIQSFFKLELKRINVIKRALKRHLTTLASTNLSSQLAVETSKRRYRQHDVEVTCSATKRSTVIKYKDLISGLEGVDIYPLRVINRAAARATSHGLSDWFAIDMPFFVGKIEAEPPENTVLDSEVRLIVAVAMLVK